MIELERVDCPRCGSARSHPVAAGRDYLYDVAGTYQASECDDCRLWFQNPRPPLDRLTELYPDDYMPHEAGDAPMQMRSLPPPLGGWMAGVQLVPRFVPGGRLLEIGCGSGSRLRALRAAGWKELHGIELVPEAAGRARADGFAVECGRVEEVLARHGDRTFDTVVASMVLEHLADPFGVLREIARVLKPRGELLFSTVVRSSLDARIYGPYWAGFDFPRHLVYFAKSDLRRATAASFDRLASFHQVAPIDFVRSSSWRKRDGRTTLFDRAVLALGTNAAVKLLHLPLALAKLTSRVSFRCVRKEEAA